MKKFLKWSAISVLALVSLVAAYVFWIINSVDPSVPPLRQGQVAVEFFAGDESQTPKPLVVAFGGAEGGNMWASDRWQGERDKFLQEGYAFLAVAYFGAPGTPEKLDRIALEGVYAAIAEAAKRPQVDGRCVALVGGSKGAELALLLASRYPEIDAVAAIVPGNAVFVALTEAMTTSSFSHNGESLPFVPLPWSATWALLKGDMRAVFDIMMSDSEAVERALIPVERINGPIFLLSATRDELWDSKGMSDAMIKRLQDKQFPHVHQHVAIDGGHTEPPRHLDLVRTFLAEHFRPGASTGCQPVP